MKAHGAAAPGGVATAAHLALKRRLKVQAATVFLLVIFSIAPLLFVVSFLTRYSGYFTDDRSLQESSFEIYHGMEGGVDKSDSQDTQNVPPDKEMYKQIEKPVSLPAISQKEYIYQTPAKESITEEDSVAGNTAAGKESLHQSNRAIGEAGKNNHLVYSNSYETDGSCELEFGSYCLWSREHREVIQDSLVKKLKDQLFEARAYYPSIAKLKGQESLAQEVKLNIQDHERMLSDAVSDYDLQPFLQVKIQKMDEAIAKAKAHTEDCYNADRKLRQILDLTEDEAHFHMKQSAFLYQLGVQTMSKTFHCLSMRLTVDYFESPSAATDKEHSISNKIDDRHFQHYVIFSRNILALSVTINSTVVNSEDSDNMVFHVLTDKQNFYSMKQWFARNSYGKATIHVLNFNELKLKDFSNLDLEEMSMSQEFRVSTHAVAQPSPSQMKIKYISVFGHCHFILSDLFTNLRKIIVLDDDVVVQKDISFLWNLDLGGKVNGAVEYCGIKLAELKSYLDADRYDGNSCAWMSGINVLNLEKWREHDITGKYQRFLRQLQLHHENEASWRAAAIQASILVFHDQIFALDDTLIQQGLGHDFQVCKSNVKKAAVLHYDGSMKPWLDLAIPKYKKYWKKYLTQEERFMEECNVNI